MSWFIAHAHHGYCNHRGDQESPDGDGKLPVEAWVRFPVLNELNSKQKSHPEHRRKPRPPCAEVKIAEIRDEQSRVVNDLCKRMRTKQQPTVTYDEQKNGMRKDLSKDSAFSESSVPVR